jgi:hypothetical protein
LRLLGGEKGILTEAREEATMFALVVFLDAWEEIYVEMEQAKPNPFFLSRMGRMNFYDSQLQ